jgi:peptidoglycan/xylan/chitin deacetylase (PgdA/CDA1 family)
VLSRRAFLGAAACAAIGIGTLLNADDAAASVPLGYRTLATTRPAVALTFDDGPDPRHTPAILDILATREVTATFFVIGRGVRSFPELVRRISAEGHEVANHTLSHERLDRLDRAGVRAQLEGGAAAIEELGLRTGLRPRLVRLPYGFQGPAARAELLAGGWEVARWRGCLERHLTMLPTDAAAARLAAGAHRGDVLLAHDGGRDRTRTVAALPALLDGLGARGLAVTTIGALQGPLRPSRPERR